MRALLAALLIWTGCDQATTGTDGALAMDAAPADGATDGATDGLWPDLAMPAGVRLAIPSYFYPGTLWTQAIAGAPTVGILLINPNSGPGTTLDPNYAMVTTQAKAAGIRVLGYVSTAYGNLAMRPLSAVTADIDTYYQLYQPSGIFFDEGPGTADCAALESHYTQAAAAARAHDPSAFLAINPGTDTCPSYLGFIDVIVSFESDAGAYAGYTTPAWMLGFPRDRFWHLVYDVAGSAQDATVRLAAQHHAGWVYVTDDLLANPWDTLPSYFSQELATAVSIP